MGFTFSKGCSFPYILPKNRMKIDQMRAELQLAKCCGGQNQKLQKLGCLIVREKSSKNEMNPSKK